MCQFIAPLSSRKVYKSQKKDAPCRDVIIKGDDIRLDKQIPHIWFGKEGPAYITNGIGVTKDPETGERNVGWYRTAFMWDAYNPAGEEYPEGYDQRYMAVYPSSRRQVTYPQAEP